MKILLTGGCGYVGTNLANTLVEKGYQVHVIDTMWFGNYLQPNKNLSIENLDIREIDKLNMDGFDSVIHLANIANDPSGDLDSKLTWEVNGLASKLLIEKAISSKVSKFIYASSGSVYGVKDEPQVTEDLSLVPISDYNKSKMIAERILLSYQDQISLSIIRPATVCGYSPRMRLDLSVSLLTMHALTKGKILVFGGDQTRPNIHMTDMIRVYLHFLKEDISGVFNAGFENISILDIAKMVKKLIDVDIEITESNDPRSYRQNSDKLLNTGFAPKFGVIDGINDVIEGYNNGKIIISDECYNIKVMKKLFG